MISATLVDYGHFLLRECVTQSGILDFWYGEIRAPSGYVPCLVRRLLPPYSQGPEYVQMFRARCRDIQAVRHPCMRRPLEFGIIESVPHAVFGLEPSWNLRDLCAHLETTGTPLPLNVVLSILLPTVHLLASVHARPGKPLVHGALKPAAVWVDRSGMVRVSDFEIGAFQEFVVRGLGKHDPVRHFMAPDRGKAWASPDPAVDVFSTGALMVELLATARLSEIQRKLTPAQKLPLLEATDLPASLVRIIATCIDNDPSRRPSMAGLHRALKGMFGSANQAGTLRAFLAGQAAPMSELVQLAQGEAATAAALRDAPRDKSVFAESTMTVAPSERLEETAEDDDTSAPRHVRSKRLATIALLLVLAVLGYTFRQQIVQSFRGSGAGMALVTVTSDPPGATVTFADGRTLGTAPLRIPVRTSADGSLELTAHIPGYFPVTLTRDPAGSSDELTFEFHLEKRPPGPATAHIVTHPPGARIAVDGKARGTSPIDVNDLLSSKPHTVTARLKGYRRASQRVELLPGEVTDVVIDLKRSIPKISFGKLTVISFPPATLFIDGHEVGPTGSDKTYRVAAGERSITLVDTRTGKEANSSTVIQADTHQVLEYAFGSDGWRIHSEDAQ